MSTAAIQSDLAEQLFMDAMAAGCGDDPYSAYRRLREAAPALLTADGTLVLSDFAGCSAALRDRALGKGSEMLGMQFANVADDIFATITEQMEHSMIMMNPPGHTRLRRLVSDRFTPRHVEALRAVIEHRVDGLLDALAAAPGGDFVAEFALPLPFHVISDLVGIPEQDREALLPSAQALAELTSPDASAETVSEIAANSTVMNAYFTDLLDSKRSDPRDDLLSRLAVADGLTDPETVATANLLFGAGFETTVNLLGNGLCALLAHPGQTDLLRASPDLIPAAVEEFLRYDPPFQIDARTVLEPTTLCGVDLAPGQLVITLLGAANHDPARHDAPDEFDITRADTEHLAFAAGAHYCLGAHLSRLEVRIALERLLDRFSAISLTGAPTRRPGVAFRGYNSIPVTLS